MEGAAAAPLLSLLNRAARSSTMLRMVPFLLPLRFTEKDVLGATMKDVFA